MTELSNFAERKCVRATETRRMHRRPVPSVARTSSASPVINDLYQVCYVY